MIWLIGDKGMLGRQIATELNGAGIFFYGSDKEVDIGDITALEKFVNHKSINWIINCSAYNFVDKCESEKDLAYQVNAFGVENLAKISNTINAKIIHFSSDYVFDGNSNKAYNESDIPTPLSVYGKSKLEGEKLIQRIKKQYFIFRISWLYGIYGNNFVKTMLRLFEEKNEINVINDQIGSPTYADGLAKNIVRLIKNNSEKYGIYHYSDEGEISWFDFAVQIQESAHNLGLISKKIKINPIKTSQYPTSAERPRYSRLDKTKVQRKLNFAILDWKMNLIKYIESV
ncbi:MAG: dTDP-4-dehydrorhamnose reductase [Candidatus Cloacimonetes bacterium]|nr:dTDP-4-dehydrorhamnose reductase [Bacteroidota bacterium]MBL7085961.1 dTDP-4-dehydrorhamnose reductase [Candidatus Cloacimonadota bacterium]